MTVYVIDANRPLPPTTKDNDHALVIGNQDTVILAAGSTIEASGANASGIEGALETTLMIGGEVKSAQSNAIITHGTITIAATGQVHGGEAGLDLIEDYGRNVANFVSNAGLIDGGTGILLDGARNVIVNSGTILGDTGIWANSNYDPGANLTIQNSGVITGSGGIAINGAYSGPNVVINSGAINGDVLFGYGNDLYDGRGGTVSGTVFLWQGDDVAYGGDGSETFSIGAGTKVIDGGAGVDTLVLYYSGTVDLRITDKQQTNPNDMWVTVRNVENLVGGSRNDFFNGNDSANAFTGGSGSDTLSGNGGDDILVGGAHNDVLDGGSGSDIAVFSGKFSDYIFGQNNQHALTITDNRAQADGMDTLTGIEFAIFSDRIVSLPTSSLPAPSPSGPASGPIVPDLGGTSSSVEGSTQNSVATVPALDSTTFPPSPLNLKGGKGADKLVGGDGDDQLNGGLGNDKLFGGDGLDVFAFTTKLGRTNVDRITDFHSAEDTIFLSGAVFGKIGKGVLAKDAFHIGPKAHDLDDRIIYNAKTGALYYDKDGSGSDYAAVKFAQLTAKTVLAAHDFLVL